MRAMPPRYTRLFIVTDAIALFPSAWLEAFPAVSCLGLMVLLMIPTGIVEDSSVCKGLLLIIWKISDFPTSLCTLIGCSLLCGVKIILVVDLNLWTIRTPCPLRLLADPCQSFDVLVYGLAW